MLSNDGTEDPLEDAFHPLMKQEKLFEAACKNVDAVLEVGFESCHGASQWRAGGRTVGFGGSGSLAGIDLGVRPIGKQPVHGDEHEMHEQFLFDAALGLGVEVLDDKDLLLTLLLSEPLQAVTGFTAVAAGWDHNVALKTDGSLWA